MAQLYLIERYIQRETHFTRQAKIPLVQLYIKTWAESAYLTQSCTNRNQKIKAKALLEDTTLSTRAAIRRATAYMLPLYINGEVYDPRSVC